MLEMWVGCMESARKQIAGKLHRAWKWVSRQGVRREWPTRVSRKRCPQECQERPSTRVCHKRFPTTIVSHKRVLRKSGRQESSSKEFHTSVLQVSANRVLVREVAPTSKPNQKNLEDPEAEPKRSQQAEVPPQLSLI